MSRYIDADALLERLERKKCEPAKVRYTEGYNDALMRCRSMVHGAPTVDAVPVDFINQKIVELQSCASQHFDDGHEILATCVWETIRLLGSFLKEWRGKGESNGKNK